MARKNLTANNDRLLVRVRPCFLKSVIDNLSDAQREWVVETGFNTTLLFNINEYPQPLSYLIAKAYDPFESMLCIGDHRLHVSEDDVYTTLGLPKGELLFEHCFNKTYTDAWRSQFDQSMYPHKITAGVICDAIKSSDVVDLIFKLNFLIVLSNVLIQGSRTPYLNLRILSYSGDLDQCFKYNWCEYLINCLNESVEQWSSNPSRNVFTGSVPFLVMCFLERTRKKDELILDTTHPFMYWTTDKLESVESMDFLLENKSQKAEIVPETSARDAKGDVSLFGQNQRAVQLIRKVCADIDRDYGECADVENEILYKYLKESIGTLENLQKQHFRLFTVAERRYQTDDILEMLKSRFINLNGEAVNFVFEMLCSKGDYTNMCSQSIDCPKGIIIENKDLSGKQGIIWDWLTSSECKAEVVFKWNQVICSKKELCSLNFGQNITAGAIDTWSCLLNLQEKLKPSSFKHRMFCFLDTTEYFCKKIKDMDYDKLLSEFSGKIEQTLQTFDFVLSSINLVFFPICSYKHYYTVCYDISEPSLVILDNSSRMDSESGLSADNLEILHKQFVDFLSLKQHPNASSVKWLEPVRLSLPWQTKYNTADSGVFVMRHMDTYFGADGLFSAERFLEESHLQQHQLNKLRFEYASLIISTSMNEERDRVFKMIDSWCADRT